MLDRGPLITAIADADKTKRETTILHVRGSRGARRRPRLVERRVLPVRMGPHHPRLPARAPGDDPAVGERGDRPLRNRGARRTRSIRCLAAAVAPVVVEPEPAGHRVRADVALSRSGGDADSVPDRGDGAGAARRDRCRRDHRLGLRPRDEARPRDDRRSIRPVVGLSACEADRILERVGPPGRIGPRDRRRNRDSAGRLPGFHRGGGSCPPWRLSLLHLQPRVSARAGGRARRPRCA